MGIKNIAIDLRCFADEVEKHPELLEETLDELLDEVRGWLKEVRDERDA